MDILVILGPRHKPRDIKNRAAVAAAQRVHGVADPDKLGMQGTSYCGYATNLLVTQMNRFKAAIDISGKVNTVSFYTGSPGLGVRNIHAPEKSQDRIGATLWQQPQKYIEHSAIMFADRIQDAPSADDGRDGHERKTMANCQLTIGHCYCTSPKGNRIYCGSSRLCGSICFYGVATALNPRMKLPPRIFADVLFLVTAGPAVRP